MNINEINSKCGGSRFLGKMDVNIPQVVTIAGLTWENVAPDNQKPQEKYVLHFHGDLKPLVMNVTNKDMLLMIHPVTDSDQWVGKQVELWNDPVVRNPNNGEMGGVRIRPLGQSAQAVMPGPPLGGQGPQQAPPQYQQQQPGPPPIQQHTQVDPDFNDDIPM